ncbi:MAG: NUDIX hydrolase [Clostridiales bacterium]|jgi:ADP-ribose pyrophosphatase|nr:NUDIX hydrolase [Clostridiales bacterium]
MQVYEGIFFTVQRESVQLPNGKSAWREFIGKRNASAIVPILPSGEVILVRQYRHAVGEHLLEIPAGVLEEDEQPEHCAARELEEETGFKAGVLTPLTTIIPIGGYCNEKIFIFTAENLTKTAQNLDADEFVEIETYSLDVAIEKIYSGEITDAKTVAALLMYERNKKQ